jgi:hypothetical protein
LVALWLLSRRDRIFRHRKEMHYCLFEAHPA